MIFRSFHDSDYHGFFARFNEDLFFVTDEEVDRADGSIYKAVMDSQRNHIPTIHHSAYIANNLRRLAM